MKWLTSAFFLGLAAWALFAFTGCADDPKPYCRTGYQMPNGIVCKWEQQVRRSETVCGFYYSQCTDGREYANPESIKRVEVCE